MAKKVKRLMTGVWRSARELVFGGDNGDVSLKHFTDANDNEILVLTTPAEPGDITAIGELRSSTQAHISTRGAQMVQGVIEEEITLATDAAATDSTAKLLPVNSYIEAVTVLCTQTITTAASYSLGDATQSARFLSASTKKTKGDSAVGTLHLNPAVASDALGPRQTADAALRVTCNTTPAAGKLLITVFYRQYVAAVA